MTKKQKKQAPVVFTTESAGLNPIFEQMIKSLESLETLQIKEPVRKNGEDK